MSSLKLPNISTPPPPPEYDEKDLLEIDPLDNISISEAFGRGLATNKIQITNTLAKTVMMDKFVRDQKNTGVFKPEDFEDIITPKEAAKEGIELDENTSRVKLEFMKTYKEQDERVIGEFGETALQVGSPLVSLSSWAGAIIGGYADPTTLLAEWGLAKWTAGGSVLAGAGARVTRLAQVVKASRAAQLARKVAPSVISNKTARLAKLGDDIGKLGARMSNPVVKGLSTKSGAALERAILVNSIEEVIIHKLSEERGYQYSLPAALAMGVFTAGAFKAIGFGLGKAGASARSKMLDLDSFDGTKGGSISERILRIQDLEASYTGIDLRRAVSEIEIEPEVKAITGRKLQSIAEIEQGIKKLGKQDVQNNVKMKELDAKLKRAKVDKSKAKIKAEMENIRASSRAISSKLQQGLEAIEDAKKAIINAPGDVIKGRVKKVRAEREAYRNRIHAERVDLIKRLSNPDDVIEVAKHIAIPELQLKHFKALKALKGKFGQPYVNKLKTYAAKIAAQGYRINPDELFPALRSPSAFKKAFKERMSARYGKGWKKQRPDESDFDAIFGLKDEDMNAYHDKNFIKKLDEAPPHKPPPATTPTKQLDEALDAAGGTRAGDFFGGLNVEVKKFFKCLATPPKGGLNE